MRLDKFLKVSRLIKRRTVANEVSDAGRILINNLPAKAGKQIKENDIITIQYANRNLVAKILKVPTGNVTIQEASGLYEIISS